jgi:hypothetical protein
MFQWESLQHNIHLVWLPPHASHKLQPLDIGPFSPLAQLYGKAVQKYTPTGYATINRPVFTRIYRDVRSQAMSERNIRAGWKRCGLFPRDMNRMLQDPVVRDLGRVTPEFQPISQPVALGNGLVETPKNAQELQQLTATVATGLSPSVQVVIRKLEHAAAQALTVAETLRAELRAIRKQTVDIPLGAEGCTNFLARAFWWWFHQN